MNPPCLFLACFLTHDTTQFSAFTFFNCMSARGVCHKMCPCFSGQYNCYIGAHSIILPNGKDGKRIKVSEGSRHNGLHKILTQGGRAKTNSPILSKSISLTWESLTHSILGDNNTGHITSFHYYVKCILPIPTRDGDAVI